MGKRWEKGDFCDLIPDIWFGVNLKNCCYQHDLDYMKKIITRKISDRKLKECWKIQCITDGKIWVYYLLIPIWVALRMVGWIRWNGIIK